MKEWLGLLIVAVVQLAVGRERSPEVVDMNQKVTINFSQVNLWSKKFSDDLTWLCKNITAYDHLYEKYDHYTHLTDFNGKAVVMAMANNIEKLLKNKVAAVKKLVDAAEEIYATNATFIPDLDVDYINSKKILSETDVYDVNNSTYMALSSGSIPVIKLLPEPKLNNLPVNSNMSTVHVPTTVFDRSAKIMNGAHWTEKLNKAYQDNYHIDKTLTWQYFCSTDGFFRLFPGMKWPRDNQESGIDFFDCRVRTWYLQAATSPKNVVILMDTSGSMKGLRMGIARSTVKQILHTLDDNDYFNIIRFSDTVEYVDDKCFNGSMIPATSLNKRRLQKFVENDVIAQSKANFEVAFEEAFRLLDREGENNKSVCNKAILLITDGVPEHHADVFAKWNWPEKNTRVFTYLIGREVKDEREVKWMACANKGFYSHISTLADVQENVQNYIKVLSRPMVINHYRNTVWTSIYLDHMTSLDATEGLKFMTSVAMPVFDRKPDNATQRKGNLLGVMGTDVPVEALQELSHASKLGVNAYAFMMNKNGYILFHPDYRPYQQDPDTDELQLNPNYNNVDMLDLIIPVNPRKLREMRKHMLSHNEGSKTVEVIVPYDNMKRVVRRVYHFYYRKLINDTFSLGIALPSTSIRKTVIAISQEQVKFENCFNTKNVEIAPWRYCEHLDPKLTGRERINRLLKLVQNETIKKGCDSLLKDLNLDCSVTDQTEKFWLQKGNRINSKSYGVNLVFLATKGGLTKYSSRAKNFNKTFFENRTSTVEADYYRRAVEGVERINGGHKYKFIFTIDTANGFNSSTSNVMVTTPIEVRDDKTPKSVAAVLGMRMRYRSFAKTFNKITRDYVDPKFCNGRPCISCDSPLMNCYLIDSHGYIMASENPDDGVGHFFGELEEETAVMNDLVEKQHMFIKYNVTDYQSICNIKAGFDDQESSGGTFSANPLTFVFRTLLWVVTELALFISEFSIQGLLSFWRNTEAEFVCNLGSLEDYDYFDLKDDEKRPCERSYVVSWVEDTNLLMVVTAGNCFCESVPFNLKAEEIKYSEKEMCDHRRQTHSRENAVPCHDDTSLEEHTECSSTNHLVSSILMLLCLFMSWIV